MPDPRQVKEKSGIGPTLEMETGVKMNIRDRRLYLEWPDGVKLEAWAWGTPMNLRLETHNGVISDIVEE